MKKKFIYFVVVLVILCNITAYADTIYTDISEDDWFYTSVAYASEKGIIHGVGNNMFNPQGILTVAEAVKLSACIHADYYDYADLKPGADSTHWADAYYDYAVENGIIKENDFLKADFDKPITRDRMFYIFANTLPQNEYPEINDAEYAPEQLSNEYIKKLFCAGIIIGNEQGFEFEKNITRADSAIVVTRMTAYSRRMWVLEPMKP